MANIAITGAAGNFGRTLARALLNGGHGLRLIDLASCDFGFADAWRSTAIYRGDILDAGSLRDAFKGADWVFHLAAILPPASEQDRGRTFRVNVEGTRRVLQACEACGFPRTVFASSVSVYGDTTGTAGLVGPEHPVNPDDLYAESKAEAERLVAAAGLPYAILRVTAVAVPEFLDPPEPWPFTENQRVELVALSDVVQAMVSLVERPGALGGTHIIAGGPTWQVSGQQYVRRWGEIMEIPLEDMAFKGSPGWLNWYDTAASQALLGYQRTSLDAFGERLRAAVEEALA